MIHKQIISQNIEMETVNVDGQVSIVTTEHDSLTGDLIGWCRYERDTMEHLFDYYGWTYHA